MKIHIAFIISMTLLLLNSCNIQDGKEGGFISRLHTPNEKVDWYKILGPTNLNKHITDFEKIDWKKEFWKEYIEDTHNYPDLEVMDSYNNTYLSVSTLPFKDDSYQFLICVGSRAIKDKFEKEIEKGYVRGFLLKSNNPENVKRLMRIFFRRNYELFFKEISKLEAIFEVEDLYQNIE